VKADPVDESHAPTRRPGESPGPRPLERRHATRARVEC
jgi:hypothetical protein